MMKVNVKWQVYDNNGQPYCVSGVEVLEDVDYDQKGWTSLGATDSDGIVNDPISDTWESRATRTYTQWVKVSGRPDEDKTTKNRKWTCSETWSTPSGCATFE
jgi:hypothetical protein